MHLPLVVFLVSSGYGLCERRMSEHVSGVAHDARLQPQSVDGAVPIPISQVEFEGLHSSGRGRVAKAAATFVRLLLAFQTPSAGCQACRHATMKLCTYRARAMRLPAPRLASTQAASAALTGLSSLIVGGGPSGLLLAHRLLDAGASVSLVEGRPDPRTPGYLEGRAYALGLGLRARTAIRTVDEALWQCITAKGFPSDRFTLRFGRFKFDLRTPDDSNAEPSILIYQSDLCAAMLDELVKRHGSRKLTVNFESKVISCNPLTGTVTYNMSDGTSCTMSADLIAGCDGVNSVVRAGLAEVSPAFEVSTRPLPGNLKVVRLGAMPAPLAPDAVSVVPGTPISAFLEPTANGACALLTWRDTERGRDPAEVSDPNEAAQLLASSLPLIGEVFNTTEVGEQFVRQRPSTAATVRCNCYHLGRAVLLGDAAHSTGGASGQGCNSALQDAAILADILQREAITEGEASDATVIAALRAYSKERVPEGQALLELSMGPGRASGPFRRAFFAMGTVTKSLLRRFGIGSPPLQTLLTTSLVPFADIRRKRDAEYGERFPDPQEFERAIAEVEQSVKVT